MDVLRRVVAEGAQVVVLQHVEHQDDARPLAPSGARVDVVAVEAGSERLLPATLVSRQVLVADDALVLPEETVHVARRVASVEGVPGGADSFGTTSSRRQRLPLGLHQVADEPPQVGVHHEVAQTLLTDSVREPEVAVVGKGEDPVQVVLDHPLLHLVEVIALLRDAERRLRGLAEAEGAEAVESGEPDIHVRRNQRVVDGRLAVFEKVVEGGERGRGPRPDPGEHAVLGGAVEDERRDPGPSRVVHLEHLERHPCGHSGIEGVTPGLEHVVPGLGGQVVPGGDHPVRAHDARPHGLDVVGAVDVAVTLERGNGGENAFRGRGFLRNAVLRNAAGDECQGEGGDHPCQMLHRVILLLLWGLLCRGIFRNHQEGSNPQLAEECLSNTDPQPLNLGCLFVTSS